MARALFFMWFVISAAPLLYGQDITFKAVADKTELSVNERFSVRFLLTYGQENVSVDHPIQLPDFDGLQQLGESTINRFQFSNGTAINQIGVEAILVADREGTFTIGSAKISLGGKKYKTEPITITVKKGLKPKAPAGQRISEAFITAELSDPTPYVNQGVILTVRMYSREYGLFQRIRNYKEPDFTNVIAKFVSERTDDYEKQVLVNGRTYLTRELARYILFPQHSGEIEIDPFSVNIFISNFYGAENIPLTTEPVVMKVKDLPTEGRPADFSGAVGEFSMNTMISKTNSKSNEAINLDVEIVGTGNLNTLKTPRLTVPKNIEIYPPKKREAYDLRPGGMKGKVVETHLLVPQYGGNYTIGPVRFNYFNPEIRKYITLNSETYSLHITGPQPPTEGSSTEKTDTASGQNDSQTGGEALIADLPGTISNVKETVTRTVEKNNGWIWIIGGLALSAAAFLLFRKRNTDSEEPKTEKQLAAAFRNDTSKKLDELKHLAQNQRKAEFVSLQEQILTGIGMHYGQTSLSEFSEDTAAQSIREKYGDIADLWKKVLADCKHSKYGLGTEGTDLKSKYQDTETLWKSFQKYKS